MDFRNVEENLRYSFRTLASDRPSGDVREIAGVSIASAGTSFQMFNAAFLASPVSGPEDLERRIATARVHFHVRELGWSFWVCADLLPPRRVLPEIEVRRVSDESTRLAFCDVGCTCFHVPLNWFREIFLCGPLWDSDFVGYVG